MNHFFEVRAYFKPSVHKPCHRRRMYRMADKIQTVLALFPEGPSWIDVEVEWDQFECKWINMICETPLSESSVLQMVRVLEKANKNFLVRILTTDSPTQDTIAPCPEDNEQQPRQPATLQT